jgi:uncharacterized protein YegP (UPF0339 family)
MNRPAAYSDARITSLVGEAAISQYNYLICGSILIRVHMGGKFMRNPKFQIYTDGRNEFRFRLRAGNGEIVLTSEGYKAKAGCQNGIESVKKNSPMDERYERKTSSNGQFYFTLKAGNGEPIGHSEHYKTAASRDKGVEVIKRIAAGAPVEESV